MSDQFFDDEQELMEAGTERPCGDDPARPIGDDAPSAPIRRDPPPFWMVLAIAAISLVLGVVIGYLVGTSVTLSQIRDAAPSGVEGPVSDAVSTGTPLPEGHPQLSVDEDGHATLDDAASPRE
ncbi:MAG: hypothetical protein SOU51_06755 [Collinsella sp.]|nr:hypothetical protein [Collinsella sp.]